MFHFYFFTFRFFWGFVFKFLGLRGLPDAQHRVVLACSFLNNFSLHFYQTVLILCLPYLRQLYNPYLRSPFSLKQIKINKCKEKQTDRQTDRQKEKKNK